MGMEYVCKRRIVPSIRQIAPESNKARTMCGPCHYHSIAGSLSPDGP
jgi:hypothetical protein